MPSPPVAGQLQHFLIAEGEDVIYEATVPGTSSPHASSSALQTEMGCGNTEKDKAAPQARDSVVRRPPVTSPGNIAAFGKDLVTEGRQCLWRRLYKAGSAGKSRARGRITGVASRPSCSGGSDSSAPVAFASAICGGGFRVASSS